MPDKNFAVISMTVFGKKPNPLRIVQLEIQKVNGDHGTKTFSSYINPEQRIPFYIEQRTGLTDEILLKSPTFREVSETILLELEDCILVGHNVSFLHFALQSEFKYLGHLFKMPQICTQRLSKKLLPHMVNYELPYLCNVLNIPFFDRFDIHEENDAVTTLFQRLLRLDEDDNYIDTFLFQKNKKEVFVPKSTAYKYVEHLPPLPGVYKFQDIHGEVIYVGKAKNIKKRVQSHFYNSSEKELQLCTSTHSIDFELTGSELLALLREADLIQKLDPELNYIQKKAYITYHIVPQKDKKGVLRLRIERRPYQHTPTEIFLKRGDAINRLIELTEKFNLCPTATGLTSKLGKCLPISYSACKGICKGLEEPSVYNARVSQALDFLNRENENYAIFEKGRARSERSFVLVLHGVYQGFGFLDPSMAIASIQDLEGLLMPKRHTYHTAKIVMAYRKKNPHKITYLN
ncbi:exonuclease domain-containing protein [Maribacter confluentis]|uniref:Excinuclease cho n=1 Tax=Maribacter confluentis TaxID=1656093 RepID=A0ABT8RX92_9FLAO|nr:exonuclease domain-containing protein [Maribacter confluentis]MDO1514531.1 exonuclease domain-containing protein [Maribacter confluentis]